ncbi:MAG: hypothetical protein QNJ81_08460 [Acidimicrobiia bacterium]|nr:hypothetical protein [Acidimicrobiia bacterium]
MLSLRRETAATAPGPRKGSRGSGRVAEPQGEGATPQGKSGDEPLWFDPTGREGSAGRGYGSERRLG